jgi:flagellar assembly protein FliH
VTTLFDPEVPADVVMLEFDELAESVAGETTQSEEADTAPTDANAAALAEREVYWQGVVERTREDAQEEGRREADARYRESLEIERSAVSLACTGFGRARERYFAEVEGEVVRLSLAIAARVLQREAAVDATLLSGVVRVALDKLSDREGAVLHVPEADAAVWRKAMKPMGLRVEPDDALEAGELVLKTMAGAAELGIGAQLVEIERGFMDLLAKRPA